MRGELEQPLEHGWSYACCGFAAFGSGRLWLGRSKAYWIDSTQPIRLEDGSLSPDAARTPPPSPVTTTTAGPATRRFFDGSALVAQLDQVREHAVGGGADDRRMQPGVDALDDRVDEVAPDRSSSSTCASRSARCARYSSISARGIVDDRSVAGQQPPRPQRADAAQRREIFARDCRRRWPGSTMVPPRRRQVAAVEIAASARRRSRSGPARGRACAARPASCSPAADRLRRRGSASGATIANGRRRPARAAGPARRST